jgi:hypothetical protein
MALIDEKEASRYLCCSVAALRKWRLLGKGPAFCRVGRLVRYSEADLVAFMAANRVEPATAEVAR